MLKRKLDWRQVRGPKVGILLIFFLAMPLNQTAFGQISDGSSFTINAPLSFQTIAKEKQDDYQLAQAHGYCRETLKLERAGLVASNPVFKHRFAEGVILTKNDAEALKRYALGFRRCIALRQLARMLAIPKHKGGNKSYAAFVPRPRLVKSNRAFSKADLRQLLIDRKDLKGLDRPLDWAKDPMPLNDEITLHQAYSELVTLAVCHTVSPAFADLGKFYDQQFYPINPYLLFGVFQQAIMLDIQVLKMRQRLKEINQTFPDFERSQLERYTASGRLHRHPRLLSLFKLCPPF